MQRSHAGVTAFDIRDFNDYFDSDEILQLMISMQIYSDDLVLIYDFRSLSYAF